jgi:hypothetical protein
MHLFGLDDIFGMDAVTVTVCSIVWALATSLVSGSWTWTGFVGHTVRCMEVLFLVHCVVQNARIVFDLVWIRKYGHDPTVAGNWRPSPVARSKLPYHLQSRMVEAQHFRCTECWRQLHAPWEIDHIQPICKGSASAFAFSNLTMIHKLCHGRKTNSFDRYS